MLFDCSKIALILGIQRFFAIPKRTSNGVLENLLHYANLMAIFVFQYEYVVLRVFMTNKSHLWHFLDAILSSTIHLQLPGLTILQMPMTNLGDLLHVASPDHGTKNLCDYSFLFFFIIYLVNLTPGILVGFC